MTVVICLVIVIFIIKVVVIVVVWCVCDFFYHQRLELFHKYATNAMCHAGIPVLEVYSMTASYPNVTLDHVHYSANAQRAAEDQLLAFIMEEMKKTSSWRDLELTDGESSHGL